MGVGCSRGCEAPEILELVDCAVADAGLDLAVEPVVALATIDAREHEPGVVAAAAARDWPIRVHPAQALAAVTVPTPSAVVAGHVGTPSVAEAAALLTAGASELLATKSRSAHATCALARTASTPFPPAPSFEVPVR